MGLVEENVVAWSPDRATTSDTEESAELTDSQRLINVLETSLQGQSEHLARLQIELNKILTSDGWRLLSRYYGARNRLLPLG